MQSALIDIGPTLIGCTHRSIDSHHSGNNQSVACSDFELVHPICSFCVETNYTSNLQLTQPILSTIRRVRIRFHSQLSIKFRSILPGPISQYSSCVLRQAHIYLWCYCIDYNLLLSYSLLKHRCQHFLLNSTCFLPQHVILSDTRVRSFSTNNADAEMIVWFRLKTFATEKQNASRRRSLCHSVWGGWKDLIMFQAWCAASDLTLSHEFLVGNEEPVNSGQLVSHREALSNAF